MNWSGSNPGLGDTATLRRIASGRDQAFADIQRALAGLASALAESAALSGRAADAFRAEVESLVPQLALLAASYAAHRDTLDSYAAAVESIRQRAAPVIGRVAQLESDLAGLWRRRYASEVPLPTPREYPEAMFLFGSAARYSEYEFSVARHLDAEIEGGESEVHSAHRELEYLAAERRYADATCAADLAGSSTRGAMTREVLSTVGGLSASALADFLLTLSPTDRAALLLAEPAVLERLARGGPENAPEVAALWVSLGPATGALLATFFPRIVGNLEGALYDHRDVANRIVLAEDVAAVAARLAGLGPPAPGSRGPDSARLELDARLEALNEIQRAMGKGRDDNPPRYLVSFMYPDGSGGAAPPLAAISHGNLDTAAYANYLVPGMDATVADSMVSWSASAADLYREQVELLKDGGQSNPSVAVVAWVGYETPNKATVLAPDCAVAGAERFTAALVGYTAVREATGSDAHLAVLAHSYGSTTAMYALQQDLGVDSFAVFGSAGQVPFTAVDMPKAQFYYMMGPVDVLAPFGQQNSFRVNPLVASGGAMTIAESDGGVYVDRFGREVLLKPALGVLGHTGYLDPGTESLHNIAAAGLGEHEMLAR